MAKNIQTPDGLERMHYGEGSVVALRGNSAQILELQKDGPISIQWAPDDYRVLDVEIRAEILDFQPFDIAVPTSPPLVLWSLQFGHGRQTISLPSLPGFLGGVTALAALFHYTLPARGMVQRLAAREIKLTLRSPALLDGSAPYAKTKVAVSFAPTHSMASNSMPMQIDAPSGLLFNTFPVEAREWRLSDSAGRPFAPAAVTFGILTQTAQAIGLALDAADWAQFRPLPVQGFFWGSAGSNIQATFR
jgi:hypothetical protein